MIVSYGRKLIAKRERTDGFDDGEAIKLAFVFFLFYRMLQGLAQGRLDPIKSVVPVLCPSTIVEQCQSTLSSLSHSYAYCSASVLRSLQVALPALLL